MKKILSLILLGALFVLTAEIELTELPDLKNWIKDPSASVTQKGGKMWIPRNGVLRSPQKYKAQYGDCLVVTFLYSGKGSVAVILEELDKDSKLLRSERQFLRNPTNELHSRSISFGIGHKKTAFYQLKLRPDKKSDLGIENIKVRRVYGAEENLLYNPFLNRELWKKRTTGNNLAKGRSVRFIPETTYFLTKRGNTDTKDLTDGKLSTKYREYIWFDPLAVGWATKQEDVFAVIDLGAVKNAGRAVFRICGGRSDSYNNYGWFPAQLEAWVSMDGKNWYRTSYLKKVNINEKADADWKTLYYLPEIQGSNAPPYVYPFELPIHAKARYVALKFLKKVHSLYMDELAIIEERSPESTFNSVYKKEKPVELFHKKTAIVPYYPEIYIHRNKGINLPNWFKLDDRREKKEGSFTYFFDMPTGISFKPCGTYPVLTRTLVKTEVKGPRTIYHFKNTERRLNIAWQEACRYGIGPLYFRAEKEIPAKERYVRISTTCGKNLDQTVVRRYKLNIIDIPEAPFAKQLILGVPWFSIRVSGFWPEYGKSLRHVGINAAGWHGPMNRRGVPGKATIEDLKKHSIKIQAVPSTSIARITGLKPKDRAYSCTGKNNGHNQICPSYRGKYYEKICKGVSAGIADVPADMIHLDYEIFFTTSAFKNCTRCDALRKSKGMDWETFTPYIMADFYKGILVETRKTFPKAVIGSYMYCLDRTQSQNGKSFTIFGTDQLYPKYLDEVQTPYYGPNPEQVNQRVRKNFLKTKDPRKVCVYLTAGAGAYGIDRMGDRTFYQLLEAYMNGAYSIAYYIDMYVTSPLDYSYMAKGMRLIVPYEDFLMKASMDPDFKGSNKNMYYTYRSLGKKALILVGNYISSRDAKTFLKLKNVASVRECISSRKLKADQNGIALTVPAGKALLLEVRFR